MSGKISQYILAGGSLAVLLVAAVLICGCTTQDLNFLPNTSISTAPQGTPVQNSSSNATANQTAVSSQLNVQGNSSEIREGLVKAWIAMRIINTDANERYLKLDLSKSDDINYLRYQLVPETVSKIEGVRDDLMKLHPVTKEDTDNVQTMIKITNYTILKYESLSTMLHASQYVDIGDPVKLKAEIREAKFQIMEALDMINEKDISQYPSMYRDQINADKQELTEMASQVEGFTRSIYTNPYL